MYKYTNFRNHDRYVVKIQTRLFDFYNIHEWHQLVLFTHRHCFVWFFSECIGNGTYLYMRLVIVVYVICLKCCKQFLHNVSTQYTWLCTVSVHYRSLCTREPWFISRSSLGIPDSNAWGHTFSNIINRRVITNEILNYHVATQIRLLLAVRIRWNELIRSASTIMSRSIASISL